MNQLSLFDWLLVAILAWSTITAFMRGFIRVLFSIGGLIAGILVAAWNYSHVAQALGGVISNPAIAQIAAFLLIAVAIMVLCSLLGRILNRTAHAIGLGFFDRLFGAAFGFCRGCLLGVAILMAIAAFLPQSRWIQNSQLSPYFLSGAHAVSFVVPHGLQQQILDGAMQLKHNAPGWIKPPR